MTPEPKKKSRYDADENDFDEYDAIGMDGLLAATEKVLAVNRGLVEPDDRDSLDNDRIYTPDRLLSEHVKLDTNRVLRNTMGRLNRTRTLQGFPLDAFGDYTKNYITSNPLVPALEEVNPMHLMEHKRRMTKLGPGGVGDPNAITLEMQGVHSSQFGFIDPLAGPESEKAGVDVRLAYGTRIGSNGRIYQKFRNRKTGKMEWLDSAAVRDKVVRLPD